MNKIILASTGACLPQKVISNEQLSTFVDTNDEWIQKMTGITKRFFVDGNETTSSLAASAAQNALNESNITKDDVDLIIVATSTPDLNFPSTAHLVQKKLNIKNAISFDISAACNGFVQALELAYLYLKSGKCKNALVIGADTLSKLLDFNQRSTAVLFGDGAGAFLLSVDNNSKSKGFLDIRTESQAEYADMLYTDGGASLTGKNGVIQMDGQGVFKHAVRNMSNFSEDLLKSNNLNVDDVSFIIPHQANIRIMQSIAKKINVDISKIISTIDLHANTSAASIPLACDVSIKNNVIKQGDLLLLTAFGAGFSYGSALIYY